MFERPHVRRSHACFCGMPDGWMEHGAVAEAASVKRATTDTVGSA
jgi:hypothetical protein